MMIDFLHDGHPMASRPMREIERIRIRNKAAKDWKRFDHWKIAKVSYSQLCDAWKTYNDIAILPADLESQPTSPTPSAKPCAPASETQ
jgi:hypothetical protein